MGTPNIWWEVFFASKRREKRKSHRELDQRDRVNCLEQRPPVLTKKRRHTSGLMT